VNRLQLCVLLWLIAFAQHTPRAWAAPDADSIQLWSLKRHVISVATEAIGLETEQDTATVLTYTLIDRLGNLPAEVSPGAILEEAEREAVIPYVFGKTTAYGLFSKRSGKWFIVNIENDPPGRFRICKADLHFDYVLVPRTLSRAPTRLNLISHIKDVLAAKRNQAKP
jgi:hypothetical protein